MEQDSIGGSLPADFSAGFIFLVFDLKLLVFESRVSDLEPQIFSTLKANYAFVGSVFLFLSKMPPFNVSGRDSHSRPARIHTIGEPHIAVSRFERS